MKRCLLPAIAVLSLAFAAATTARAQASGSMSSSMPMPSTMASMPAPPNILMIETDNIKPYMTVPYDKVAEQYIAPSVKAKLPGSVIAMEALTGAPRAQYLFAYDSFQGMQDMEDMINKNDALHSTFKALDAQEAAYTSEVHNVIWHYRDDLSNSAASADIPHDRFWESIVFHIKPGHDQEFEAVAKMYKDAYAKIGVNLHWATFESEMGASDTYIVLLPMVSLKDEDDGLARQKTVMDAFGADGMHQMEETARDAYMSIDDTLWEVNPKTSYVPKEWIAANPDFWAPKPAGMMKSTMAPAMKPAPKPAQ